MLVCFDHRRPDEVAPFASVVDRLKQWPVEILLIVNKRVYLFVDSCPGHNKPDYNGDPQVEMTELQSPDKTKAQ